MTLQQLLQENAELRNVLVAVRELIDDALDVSDSEDDAGEDEED
jgi:hypothetical protein